MSYCVGSRPRYLLAKNELSNWLSVVTTSIGSPAAALSAIAARSRRSDFSPSRSQAAMLSTCSVAAGGKEGRCDDGKLEEQQEGLHVVGTRAGNVVKREGGQSHGCPPFASLLSNYHLPPPSPFREDNKPHLNGLAVEEHKVDHAVGHVGASGEV